MAIPFNCECGKKLQAKEEFAGRKMKCPKCGRVLTIPRLSGERPANAAAPQTRSRAVAADTMPMPAKAAPPLPAAEVSASAEFVHFVCSCGRKMKARRRDAGSVIDCPTCGRELTIPTHDSDVPPEPKFGPVPVTAPATSKGLPAPATSRQLPPPLTARLASAAPAGRRGPTDSLVGQSVTPWLSDEHRQLSGRPPREKPVSRMWPAVLVVLCLCGLVGAGAVEVSANKAPKPTEPGYLELDLVPHDAVAVVSVRRPQPTEKKAKGTTGKLLAALNTPIKWAESDFERITVVTWKGTASVNQGITSHTIYFIRTKNPYSVPVVFRKVFDADAAEPLRVYDRTVYVEKTKSQAPPNKKEPPKKAVLLLDAHLFALGTTKSFEALFEAPLGNGPLQQTANAMRLNNDLIIGHKPPQGAPLQVLIASAEETPAEVMVSALQELTDRADVFFASPWSAAPTKKKK